MTLGTPSDATRRSLRLVLGLFLALTCLRVWTGTHPWLPQAQAQIPDSGEQRKLILDEARRANVLLSDIRRLLETGTVNVRCQGADNQADPPAKSHDAGRPRGG